MVRSPSIDKNGMRKGEWSKEEDDKLRAYITKYGVWNWRQLPQFAGLSRCGKSCRLRWKNYLQPNVKRGNYTKEEEDLIFNLHNQLGKKWSVIATKLPGRTDNEIKNYWHTHLKKRTEALNLTLPSNPKKIKSKRQTPQISKEEIDQKLSSESDKGQQIISPTLSEDLTGSPNESCCSELSQSYSDAPLTDLFSWVQKNGVRAKSCEISNAVVSQEINTEDYESEEGSACNEMSFGCSDVSDLMAWFGEDNSMTSTSFRGLDDIWSQSFETDDYMINAFKHEEALLDPGLVYPSSPSTQEVFLWSYDLSDVCIR